MPADPRGPLDAEVVERLVYALDYNRPLTPSVLAGVLLDLNVAIGQDRADAARTRTLTADALMIVYALAVCGADSGAEANLRHAIAALRGSEPSPPGYEFTGETREPVEGEEWLSVNGLVVHGRWPQPRRILRRSEPSPKSGPPPAPLFMGAIPYDGDAEAWMDRADEAAGRAIEGGEEVLRDGDVKALVNAWLVTWEHGRPARPAAPESGEAAEGDLTDMLERSSTAAADLPVRRESHERVQAPIRAYGRLWEPTGQERVPRKGDWYLSLFAGLSALQASSDFAADATPRRILREVHPDQAEEGDDDSALLARLQDAEGTLREQNAALTAQLAASQAERGHWRAIARAESHSAELARAETKALREGVERARTGLRTRGRLSGSVLVRGVCADVEVDLTALLAGDSTGEAER
jgi:hypothetical protein